MVRCKEMEQDITLMATLMRASGSKINLMVTVSSLKLLRTSIRKVNGTWANVKSIGKLMVNK
jgi:hypothetical protein